MDPRAYLEIAQAENRHWWFLARRKIIEGIIRDLNLPPNAGILELGAGTGGNLNMLAQFGNVCAAEMDDFAREAAVQQTDGRFLIEYGRCPDAIPFRDARFDLICMFDVLEHVSEDVETLAELRTRLAPGGRLLLTVPAYQWMWSSHDEFLHHMRRYTNTELTAKLQKTGFRITKSTYFNSFLFPLAVIVRLKDRITKKHATNVNELPSPMVNDALRRVFEAEAQLVRSTRFPFGLSLLAIAENA